MENLIGQLLDHYKVISLLGEGGMGAVYKGLDVTLQRNVAIKVMHPDIAAQPGFQERFLQEARTAASLDHPNIVSVYDFGQQRGHLFIVMKFITGSNLSDMLNEMRARGRWIPLAEAVELMRQIALSLDYVHRRGILHRDIKPGNIMIEPGVSGQLAYRPILTDLGLAKLVGGTGVTQAGVSLGTPAYMSPEQALGKPVDARSDVYSLGILLYELVVGQLPFAANNLQEAAIFHTQRKPPSPRSIRPDLPESIERIILKALEKVPENRFASAGDLAKALEGSLSAATMVASPPPTVVGGGVVSLATYCQPNVEPRGASVLGEFQAPASSSHDTIQIMGKDKATRTYTITKSKMTIGRTNKNDIFLDDSLVSRSHAQIEFDGTDYRVTDLNSSNGTFLAGNRLLAGVPEIWTVGKVLQVGDHWLNLIRTQAPVQTAVSPGKTPIQTNIGRPETSVARSVGPGASITGRNIGVVLGAQQLTVEPGKNTPLQVTVHNQGAVVDHFKVALEGIPSPWVSPPSQTVQLLPGEQDTVTFTVSPPRNPQSRAGRYPFQVRVTSQNAPDQGVDAKSTMTVAAFTQFTTELFPQKLRTGRIGRLTIRNTGNAQGGYTLTFKDRADELNFTPPVSQVTVGEGQALAVEFVASAKKFRLFGGQQTHSFTAQVKPTDQSQGEAQTQNGEIVSRGLIQIWLIILLIGLCVTVSGIAIAAYKTITDRNASNTATVAAMIEGTLDAENINLQSTNAAATSLAGTVTAEGDDDLDGLSNAMELTLGTDPKVADTDGDGLNDGAEHYQWGTDPLDNDTDNDNLSDGKEVNAMGTNPLSQDTDGDGILDNVDPDPGKPPTPTLTPTLTYTPSMTPTFTLTFTPTPSPTVTPPPDGVSMNCDGTYQRYTMIDGGSSGKTVTLDNWNGNAWINVYKLEGGDPMTRQLETDGVGLKKFGGCERLLIVAIRYSGSGYALELHVLGFNGSGTDELLWEDGAAGIYADSGTWSKDKEYLTIVRNVFLYGEPHCCPCNRQTIVYKWNGSAFEKTEDYLTPTYSGDPPAECQP